jgi:uncharacterized protein YjbI with pentapeptide repeats
MRDYTLLDANRIERLNEHAKFIESKGKNGKCLELLTYDDMMSFFKGYDFTGYNLQKIDFTEADCRSCNFTRCDLTSAEFIWSIFDENTVFTDAILKDTVFYETYEGLNND